MTKNLNFNGQLLNKDMNKKMTYTSAIMKSIVFHLLLMAVISTAGNAQVKNALGNVKQQAGKMGTAFINADYKTFAKYNNPTIVKMMGGEAGLIKIISGTMDQMKQSGVVFNTVSFGEPSALVKSGTDWQCTIPQIITMTTGQGKFSNTTTLIGISSNNGVKWTFIDTTNKDADVIKKVVHNLSSKLVIPVPQGPVKLNN